MHKKSIRRIWWGGILISAIILMMQVQHTETSRYTSVIERSNLDLKEMEVTDYDPAKLKDEVQQFATYKKRSKEELQLLKEEEMLIQQYTEIINKEEGVLNTIL